MIKQARAKAEIIISGLRKGSYEDWRELLIKHLQEFAEEQIQVELVNIKSKLHDTVQSYNQLSYKVPGDDSYIGRMVGVEKAIDILNESIQTSGNKH